VKESLGRRTRLVAGGSEDREKGLVAVLPMRAKKKEGNPGAAREIPFAAQIVRERKKKKKRGGKRRHKAILFFWVLIGARRE